MSEQLISDVLLPDGITAESFWSELNDPKFPFIVIAHAVEDGEAFYEVYLEPAKEDGTRMVHYYGSGAPAGLGTVLPYDEFSKLVDWEKAFYV